MFKIDLLKGQGIPIKSRPEGVAIGSVAVTIPIIIGMMMFGIYINNTIAMGIQQKSSVNYKTKTKELSEAVELKKSFDQEVKVLDSCMQEITKMIGRHTQVTPLLVDIAKHIPESTLMTNLQLSMRTVKLQKPTKADPKKKVKVDVPIRTLKITLCCKDNSDCDDEVRSFKEQLYQSPAFGPRLENILVSQEMEKLDEKDVVCYQINCIFKSEF